jgi:hypothetical protein
MSIYFRIARPPEARSPPLISPGVGTPRRNATARLHCSAGREQASDAVNWPSHRIFDCSRTLIRGEIAAWVTGQSVIGQIGVVKMHTLSRARHESARAQG